MSTTVEEDHWSSCLSLLLITNQYVYLVLHQQQTNQSIGWSFLLLQFFTQEVAVVGLFVSCCPTSHDVSSSSSVCLKLLATINEVVFVLMMWFGHSCARKLQIKNISKNSKHVRSKSSLSEKSIQCKFEIQHFFKKYFEIRSLKIHKVKKFYNDVWMIANNE